MIRPTRSPIAASDRSRPAVTAATISSSSRSMAASCSSRFRARSMGRFGFRQPLPGELGARAIVPSAQGLPSDAGPVDALRRHAPAVYVRQVRGEAPCGERDSPPDFTSGRDIFTHRSSGM